MGTIANFLANLDKVDIIQVASDSLHREEPKLKALNIKQLMAGQNNKGQPLSPKYSEDPYFKTASAAAAYAAWKKKLFPETPFDTPNLIIRGDTHASLQVKVNRNQINFSFGVKWGGDISSKYKDTELGLSPESKVIAYNTIVQPDIVNTICQVTGAKKGRK